MKLLLTRIGFNSKFFISGDIEQTDRFKDKTQSGLYDAINRLHDMETSEFTILKIVILLEILNSKILSRYE